MAKFCWMRSTIFAGILLILSASAGANEEYQPNDVVVLTDITFGGIIEALENSLVMFHAPWCGHCKRLAPEFVKAAAILKNKQPPVFLVKVDCTDAGKETCAKFKVRGYPTLKIFKWGELVADYEGTRESAGIVEYMQNHLSDDSEENRAQKNDEL